ncbi:MAG: NADH-quinone oxidoreductase subunit NuoN [Rhizobiales bacterium]|nr:NADH-quinone oxidoreductase subunit NuoN [Hyphomicrobiales bacterium]NRB12854.1 NADH-quinone oxidoreductase subunit NuoN [Hyphomicrobiales bacterium]
MSSENDFLYILPELTLIIGALVALLIAGFKGKKSVGFVANFGLGLMVLAAIISFFLPAEVVRVFNGLVINDSYSIYMKILTLFGAAATLLMIKNFLQSRKLDQPEFIVLLIFATVGMMFMISANNLLTLYLGIELQSLSLYILAAFNRSSTKATESGLKYFILGALSSGMLLFGMSYIYGFTGSTSFDLIAQNLSENGSSMGVIFGLTLMSAGLMFKISAVPFHMWTPDVYEGAPTPVTAFFATAPKVAAMAMIIRVLYSPFIDISADWQQIVVFVAIASMVLGGFAGIAQNNIKRLMAYSSIAHMGYALVGLAAFSEAGTSVKAVILYMSVYLITTLGVFACILAMKRSGDSFEKISDLAGMWRNHPIIAISLTIFMFSLTGMPPFAGFFAKFYVFSAAVNEGLWLLAVVGVLASVVGAYYYLRIIKVIYFDESKEPFDKMAIELKIVLGFATIFTLIFTFFPSTLLELAQNAAQSLN